MKRILERNLIIRRETIEAGNGRWECLIVEEAEWKLEPIQFLRDIFSRNNYAVITIRPYLIFLYVGEFQAFWHVFESKLVSVHELSEFGFAVAYAGEVMPAVFRYVRVRVMECRAVSRAAFVYAIARSLRLIFLREIFFGKLHFRRHFLGHLLHRLRHILCDEKFCEFELAFSHVFRVQVYKIGAFYLQSRAFQHNVLES